MIQAFADKLPAEFTKDLGLYEVNLRQYTESGTFREFASHLPRLQAMGVGILWLMPIHPIGLKNRKGNLGSYYAVQDYCAIDPVYGTMEDFTDLVREIHDRGMYVILDWVANHTAWDHAWTESHHEYYERDEEKRFLPPFPEWEDVIHLDFSMPGLRREMTNALRFWVEKAGIDGYRCDMANLVRYDYWQEAITELRALRPLFFLAEAEDRALLEAGFDCIYNWNTHHWMNGLVKGQSHVIGLESMLNSDFHQFPPGSYQLLFTSNHDENSWNGSAIERLGIAMEACVVLSFTLPGIPLVYGGQEAGQLERLKFFDKDLIHWKEDKMSDLFTKLYTLKKRNKSLWNGAYGGSLKRIPNSQNARIFSFLREKEGKKVLVLINFSHDELSVQLSIYPISGEYTDVMTGRRIHLAQDGFFRLKPWGFHLFEK